jgi:hypothetical protein
MHRSSASALALSCLLTACAGRISAALPTPVVASSVSVPMPAAEPEPAPPAAEVEEPERGPGPAYGPGEDRHWIQADDYFVSDRPWQSNWMYVHLAKMKRPASAESKDQALFFQLDNSRDVWTQHYWRTRPAAPGELALGALVLCFNDDSRDGVYHAPPSKDRARTGAWFMGKITDVSDAYKHVVKIDVYNCAMNAVRVVHRER